jgi:hypothetical protein
MGFEILGRVMTSNELRQSIQTRPFKPFRPRFGSGDALDVPHPDFIAMSPSGRTAVIFGQNGDFDQGDGASVVDVLLIERIEFPPPRGNGTQGNGNISERM